MYTTPLVTARCFFSKKQQQIYGDKKGDLTFLKHKSRIKLG